MWYKTDSWSDSDEEDSVQEYRHARRKASSGAKIRIKRQPGHYNIRESQQLLITPKIFEYELGSARFTLSAAEYGETAGTWKLGRTEQQNEFASQVTLISDDGDDEQEHHKEMLDNIETERERQTAMVSLLAGMKDDGVVQTSSSLQPLLREVTDTNHRKSIVQQQLVHAFERYDEDEVDRDREYKDAMMEMMDESLVGLKMNLHRKETREMEEKERQLRIDEASTRTRDANFVKSKQMFDGVLKTLLLAFRRVRAKNSQTACQNTVKQTNKKEDMLQELRRRYAGQCADMLSVEEKSRRIKEDAKPLTQDEDLSRDELLKVLARVQRQLILKKFAGKWVNVQDSKKRKDEMKMCDGKNDYDTQLKMMRLRARRKSCVASEDTTD